ncbi:MAG: glycosyltransferase family 2 protein [Anaerolineales bacterium]
MRTSVILPALDEAESISGVLAAISPEVVSEVIVVDGGSRDDTPSIAESVGACVIHEPRRGYGRACAAGVSAASGECLVFMDADGADDPSYLTELVHPIWEGTAELALGSRLAGALEAGAMPWHQQAGNWLASWLIRSLYGVPLTDLSPFRAVSKAALLSLDLQDMAYGWPTEMITKAARQGWRIVEIPVAYRRRSGGHSKISGTLRGSTWATYAILNSILRDWRR